MKMKSNKRKTFVLYAGPLDGAEVCPPVNVAEGSVLEFDLGTRTYLPEVNAMLNAPSGAVCHYVLTDGVLRYTKPADA